MKALLTSVLLAIALHAVMLPARAAECGTVSIAQMNWGSAGIAANFDRFILEKGYGCLVTIVEGDTLETLASMKEAGHPDIAPEFWVSGVRSQFDAALSSGRVLPTSEILSDGAVEGWWIPKFIADANPDIRSVRDALAHPELFPAPDDPAKGAVYNCPSDWSCHVSTINLFTALDAERSGFELVETGSPEGLDESITQAFDNKVGWLGYYWAPSVVLGKYEMTRLSFGTDHDKPEWDRCTSIPDCPRPVANAYPVSKAFTLVSKDFADRAPPAVMAYLKARSWDNSTINAVLAWQDENRKSNEDVAAYFLQNYAVLWTKWVPADVAEKVKAAL